jgi:HSP90 family molecular chaperone
MSQSYTFQAETQQLLDILIHSLYTERDIFLRELISNASDALNRMQFELLTNTNVLDPDAELSIDVVADEAAGTLTISDSGIGMTEEEIRENLGTIARSGAKQFIQAVKDAPNAEAAQNIIGQFGVGFYSVFMVADKVRVVSRSYKPDAQAVAWEATGGTTYTIEPAEKAERGTDIIITLKDDAKEYLQAWKLKNIIKRHSDFIEFPIHVNNEEEPANERQAIWRKAVKDVSDEDYKQFYQSLTMDFNDPLHRLHIRADVPMQYYSVLFIPSSSEQTLFNLRREPGLKLYARKVLIQEYCKDLLPEYLQFIQGVVDSEDLPLNVSRESVKSDRIMANLRSALTKRVLSDLKRLLTHERDAYIKIFKEFGRFIKQGVVMAPQDRDDVMELLLFHSSREDSQTAYVTLSEYVARMVENQKDIYFVVADDFQSARRSPHLDAFRQRGIEVLYFCDPVDALLPMGLTRYKDAKLVSVDDANIDLSNIGTLQAAESQPEALAEQSVETLIERVKRVLGDRVKGVQESKTLVGSPARLVSTDGGGSRHMFRINRLMDRDYELPVKTLELNPRHPLMHNLAHRIAAQPDDPLIDTVIEQVFETALLQEGIHPDPASMADRLTALMEAATRV